MTIRNFIYTILAALPVAMLTASCAKTSLVADGPRPELAVRPLSPPASKASSAYTGGPFGVFAYASSHADGTVWTTGWADAEAYLGNVAFAQDGDVWTGWDCGSDSRNPYYYPLTGSLLFAGYSPHSDVSSTVRSVTLEPNRVRAMNPYLAIDFEQTAEVEDMEDLLFFDVADANAGRTVAKTPDAIDVVFRHALARVSFSFHDAERHYAAPEVRVKGCVFKGVFYSGLTPGWYPDLAVTADYVLPAEDADAPELLDGWNSASLFLPSQYLDGIFHELGTTDNSTGKEIVLEIDVTDGFGTQTVKVPLKNYTDHWQMGYHYIYDITLTASPIEFGEPQVTITERMLTI